MERLSTAAQTDAAFRSALSGDFDPLERLTRLYARHRALSMVFDSMVVVQGRLASPKLKAENLAKRALHDNAAKAVGRRIRRLVKRGVL